MIHDKGLGLCTSPHPFGKKFAFTNFGPTVAEAGYEPEQDSHRPFSVALFMFQDVIHAHLIKSFCFFMDKTKMIPICILVGVWIDTYVFYQSILEKRPIGQVYRKGRYVTS